MTANETVPAALAVTTATGVIGVAVGPLGGPASASVTLETDRRHSEELVPAIQDLLARVGWDAGRLKVLVVDVGPGRFTGLRVGLATIRSLAFGLSIPVVGMTSLEILAAGRLRDLPESDPASVPVPSPGASDDQRAVDQLVTAVIDARRGEVFQQVFAVTPAGGVEARSEAVVGSAEHLAGEAAGTVIGDGADEYGDVYRRRGLPVISGVDPDPGVMLALARHRSAVPGREVSPVYLRDPDVNPSVKVRPRVPTS